MERLKHMKEVFESVIEGQLNCLNQVDTHELGEVVDILKDIEEAMYYCSIVKAMEKTGEEEEYMKKYLPYYRDMDKTSGKMYYGERYPYYYRENDRSDRSYKARKSYMESKELHKDSRLQMQELERYVQELTSDIMEMIAEATPEEKTVLQQKITLLANKIK